MAGSKLVPLYEQVVRRIEQEIESGRFGPGDKLYSIREMCEQFNVSDVTAKKALRLLSARGVVRTVTGSGVFVEDPGNRTAARPAQKQLVAFLKIGKTPAPVFTYEIDLIQRELSDLGFAMLYCVSPTEEDIHRAIEHVKSAEAAYLVVFPQHFGNFEQASYMSALRRTGLPLLVVETRSEKDSYVVSDAERATREVADYLYETGHRRICLATTFSRKLAGFEQAVAAWNDKSVQASVIGETGKSDSDTRSLAEKILSLPARPTAVIASDDHAAAVLVSQFQARGLNVPEDISVVGFDDLPNLASLSPVPLTVLRHPCREVAQEVGQWIRRQAQGGSRRRTRREITGTLILRDSSGPPPSE